MTLPLLVYAKDSLIISIDGGGFAEIGTMKLDPESGLETSRRYFTNQVKHFKFDFSFLPVLLVSGSLWASEPDRPDRLRSISSRIPVLKEHLRSRTITNLPQFTEELIEFAQLDLWGVNGSGIDFFISGLVKTGGRDRFTTLVVNLAGGVASTPTQIIYGLDRRFQDETFIHWTFPCSTDQQKYFPDQEFMTQVMFYPFRPKDWEVSFPSIIKDLDIYHGYIKAYLRKVHAAVVPPRLPTSQEALFFSAAVQSAAITLSSTHSGIAPEGPIKPVEAPITLYSLNARKGTLSLISELQLPMALRKYL